MGVIITLSCETDFVAKNDAFVELAHELAEQALVYATKEEFLASDFHGITVADKLIEQTGVIGEKLKSVLSKELKVLSWVLTSMLEIKLLPSLHYLLM
jgi:translation elongation factor EF-Ts